MDEKQRVWCLKQLDKLPYVKWDRYFYVEAQEEVITVFGWIDREKDAYKDFVVIQLEPSMYGVYFLATSSSKYTADIAEKLESEHSTCLPISKLKRGDGADSSHS
jgi:hypothetical protein